jgi:hypothetical protein
VASSWATSAGGGSADMGTPPGAPIVARTPVEGGADFLGRGARR